VGVTTEKEATEPPAKNFLQQQAKFDRFIERYNQGAPTSGSEHEVFG
jgi:putative transposase